jgi:hypothetical protein
MLTSPVYKGYMWADVVYLNLTTTLSRNSLPSLFDKQLQSQERGDDEDTENDA